MSSFTFSSESVTEGHPDKVADQVSDAILDEILNCDPYGRVAVETFVTTGLAMVGGEISTKCYVEIPQIVRNVIKDVGYTNAKYGFDYNTCAVITTIDQQSPDIAMGVDRLGAGDQGMMFGYATKETEEYMPLSHVLAHKLCKTLADKRKDKSMPFLRPDGKAQVSVTYVDNKPVSVDTVVVSTQHDENIEIEKLREAITEEIILKVIPQALINKDKIVYHINPTGRFVEGGPKADTGLTGRKIIVDTYGGFAHHGGGCFSGKDPTKVDRSAAYATRWIAKNLVAAEVADRIELQVAYAIGVAEPVSLYVNSFGTGKLSDDEIINLVKKNFDLTPAGIINDLKLRRPVYRQTAAYGHYGRSEEGFSWEKLNKVEDLKKG